MLSCFAVLVDRSDKSFETVLETALTVVLSVSLNFLYLFI